MSEKVSHTGLAIRLADLATRIDTLKLRLSASEGMEKVEIGSQIDQLRKRHAVVEGQLRRLDRADPQMEQALKSEIDEVTDDLSNAVENFMTRADKSYRPL